MSSSHPLWNQLGSYPNSARVLRRSSCDPVQILLLGSYSDNLQIRSDLAETAHVLAMERDMAAMASKGIPDDFSGYIVHDWEAWKATWDLFFLQFLSFLSVFKMFF